VKAFFYFKLFLFSFFIRVFKILFFIKYFFILLFKKIKKIVISRACGSFLNHKMRVMDEKGQLLNDWERIKRYIRGKSTLNVCCERCSLVTYTTHDIILMKKGVLNG